MKIGATVHATFEGQCGFWLFVDNVDNKIYQTLGS
jgi:hypothetical protein